MKLYCFWCVCCVYLLNVEIWGLTNLRIQTQTSTSRHWAVGAFTVMASHMECVPVYVNCALQRALRLGLSDEQHMSDYPVHLESGCVYTSTDRWVAVRKWGLGHSEKQREINLSHMWTQLPQTLEPRNISWNYSKCFFFFFKAIITEARLTLFMLCININDIMNCMTFLDQKLNR